MPKIKMIVLIGILLNPLITKVYGQSVLVPGAGWTEPTLEPEPIGTSNDLGYDAKCMALWDVVPHQEFTGEFGIGVVAFHMNGIDRVEFAVNGGTWVPVKEMTLNPRVKVWEYWVMLKADCFLDGKLEVRAIAYPKRAGIPRVLDSLFLFVDRGGLSHDTLWVDKNNGNDIKADGSVEKPFSTIDMALETYWSENTTWDGLTINVAEGEYNTPGWNYHDHERWLTVTSAPGADPAQVKFVNRNDSRCNIQYLKFRRVTFAPNSDDVLLYPARANRYVWFDACAAQGLSRYISQWGINRNATTYFTDHAVYDYKHGISSHDSPTPLIRNVHCRRVGEDSFRINDGNCLLVNCSVEDVDPGTSDFHPDIVNLYNLDWWENIIIYGLTAIKDINSQGVSPCWIKDMAVINCLIHRDPKGVMGMNLEAPLDHYLISNSTFTTQSISLRGTHARNVCFYNSVFNRLSVYNGVTQNQFNDLILCSNIHIVRPERWVVSDGEGPITFGNPGFIDFDNLDFRPDNTSILLNRVVEPMIPIDVNSQNRGEYTAIGALGGESESRAPMPDMNRIDQLSWR